MKKLVVVTGGAGFIGSHLCERLVSEGYRVISLDNYSAGSKDNHLGGVDYREGHTRDIAEIIPESPNLVYHLGEYSRVEQSFQDVPLVMDFNVVGTAAVLEFCRIKQPKLVYAGSSTKYAHDGDGRMHSPYAWTKASNTELVKRYSEWYKFPYAITYFYNVYGPRERASTQNGTLIAIFADKHKRGEPLTVRLPGTQKRNFTHVYDIVDGLIMVGEKGDGDEYGLGHHDAYSVLDVASMFGSPIETLSERPGNRHTSGVNIDRAYRELGWEPKHSLEDYIRDIKNSK